MENIIRLRLDFCRASQVLSTAEEGPCSHGVQKFRTIGPKEWHCLWGIQTVEWFSYWTLSSAQVLNQICSKIPNSGPNPSKIYIKCSYHIHVQKTHAEKVQNLDPDFLVQVHESSSSTSPCVSDLQVDPQSPAFLTSSSDMGDGGGGGVVSFGMSSHQIAEGHCWLRHRLSITVPGLFYSSPPK